jgi:hypothetical protein
LFCRSSLNGPARKDKNKSARSKIPIC